MKQALEAQGWLSWLSQSTFPEPVQTFPMRVLSEYSASIRVDSEYSGK